MQIIKNNAHPGAVNHVLEQMVIYWETINDPWKYSTKIMKKQNGNYWEREHIEDHEQVKTEFTAFIEKSEAIQNLIGGIGWKKHTQ